MRPAAARHLGVPRSEAELLVFLDPDTLPAPEAIARLAAWPATIPDALVVGRRHHVDLAGWDPEAPRRGSAATARHRSGSDPAWLDDGYRARAACCTPTVAPTAS